jgi:signal transduction histidine kinase
LPPVDADGDAIAQILVNLIHNAIKYSADERYVGIDVAADVRRGRRGVLISVHDRGIGIRPEDRAHLTDSFFRASDDRVRQRGGTGLGLALVKHIVEAHHGSLDVESRLVKGSTFRVFLPASSRVTTASPETAGAVDDSPANADSGRA